MFLGPRRAFINPNLNLNFRPKRRIARSPASSWPTESRLANEAMPLMVGVLIRHHTSGRGHLARFQLDANCGTQASSDQDLPAMPKIVFFVQKIVIDERRE